MTLIIDVPPDVERALQEQAHHSGQTLAAFAASYLTELARLGEGDRSVEQRAELAARLAALGRIGCYGTRVQAGLPPLSEEDVSRSRIYEGRGL